MFENLLGKGLGRQYIFWQMPVLFVKNKWTVSYENNYLGYKPTIETQAKHVELNEFPHAAS